MKRMVWLATILSLLLIANLAYAGGKGSRGGSSSGSSAKYESSGKQRSDSGSSQSVKPSSESKPSHSSSYSHESKPSYSPSSSRETKPSYSPKPSFQPSAGYQPKPSSQGSYSYGPKDYSKPTNGPTYNYQPKPGGTTYSYGGAQPSTKYQAPAKPQSSSSGQPYAPQKSEGPQYRDPQKTQPGYTAGQINSAPQKSDGPKFQDAQQTRQEYSYGKFRPNGDSGSRSGGVVNKEGRPQGYRPGDTAVLNDGHKYQAPNRDEGKLEYRPGGRLGHYSGPGRGHRDYGYGRRDDDHYDRDHYYEHGHARHHCDSGCHWWRPLFTFSYSWAYPVYVEVPVPYYYGPDRPYDWSYLDDCEIYAADGAYLGIVARNYYREDSIANPEGPFGSRWSSTSIFNSECAYGDANSALSPWNPYTTTPPRLFYQGKFRAYLTVNTGLQPRVDPRWVVDGYLGN